MQLIFIDNTNYGDHVRTKRIEMNLPPRANSASFVNNLFNFLADAGYEKEWLLSGAEKLTESLKPYKVKQ